MTVASMKDTLWLIEKVLYIYYPLHFQKDFCKIRVLIELGSEINIMTSAYTAELGLKIQKTNIGAQKIDGFTFDTFGIVLATFQMENKLDTTRFF